MAPMETCPPNFGYRGELPSFGIDMDVPKHSHLKSKYEMGQMEHNKPPRVFQIINTSYSSMVNKSQHNSATFTEDNPSSPKKHSCSCLKILRVLFLFSSSSGRKFVPCTVSRPEECTPKCGNMWTETLPWADYH